jgi:hypothetical protein
MRKRIAKLEVMRAAVKKPVEEVVSEEKVVVVPVAVEEKVESVEATPVEQIAAPAPTSTKKKKTV